MPKRVIDFDALWASDKLASCAEWAQSEYAWLYGLADASGSFEMTNLRVIWGRVAAIRKNLTLERLREIFDEFIARGLLFTWEEHGKLYGHWTGSDVPGRLPAPSWRVRLEKLAPPVPPEALAAYSARFGGSKEGIVARGSASTAAVDAASAHGEFSESGARELKPGVEEPQAQDLGLDLEKDSDLERKMVCPAPPIPVRTSDAKGSGIRSHESEDASAGETQREMTLREGAAEGLLEIYETERGGLPPAGALTAARGGRCARWLAAGFTPEEFRAAVRTAAATPFLAGDGLRGWQASFDWLIANRSNVRKVLAGEYALRGEARDRKSGAERRGLADLYTGMAPRPADCGVRVNPAALARIRARQTFLDQKNAVIRSGRTAFFGSTTAELRDGAGGSEKPADPSRADALFAPDNTGAPGHRELGAEQQPRASPAALKS